MHTNNSFIQGQENMKFLVKANSNKEYNDYLFNQVNIKDVKLVSLLNILSPFIYLINVTVTFVFILSCKSADKSFITVSEPTTKLTKILTY